MRARRKAKQLARAATLAAVAAEQFPNDVPTAQLAKETLDEAGPQIHEVRVECATECAIAVDGRVASQFDGRNHRLFLEPGAHEVGVSFRPGGSTTRRIDATKGGKETLAFAAVALVEAPGAGTGTGAGTGESAARRLPPALFFVAAAVTLGLGGATIVSGIDATNSPGVDAVRRACAGKDVTCPEYRAGKSAEARTNVLLGATVGATLITGVVGIFLTRWSSAPVKVGAAPLPGGGSIDAQIPF